MGSVKMASSKQFKTAHSYDPNKRSGNKRGRKMPESVILDRKGRKVGSDDALNAARVAKWAEQEGLRGTALEVAFGVSQALEAAVALSLDGEHHEAGKKAASINYVLKRNERVSGLKVQCRDGRTRKLGQIVEWYSKVHFRIAEDVAEARAQEAELEATRKRNAELKKAAAAAIQAAERKVA